MGLDLNAFIESKQADIENTLHYWDRGHATAHATRAQLGRIIDDICLVDASFTGFTRIRYVRQLHKLNDLLVRADFALKYVPHHALGDQTKK